MSDTRVSETMQVNEVIRAFPTAVGVFSRYGIDSCCGGSRSLAEVATRHGFDLDELVEELSESAAVRQSGGGPTVA